MFIDEIDALLAIPEMTELALTLIDGVGGLDSVTILAATNRLELLTPAIRRTGRLELSIELQLPNFVVNI